MTITAIYYGNNKSTFFPTCSVRYRISIAMASKAVMQFLSSCRTALSSRARLSQTPSSRAISFKVSLFRTDAGGKTSGWPPDLARGRPRPTCFCLSARNNKILVLYTSFAKDRNLKPFLKKYLFYWLLYV